MVRLLCRAIPGGAHAASVAERAFQFQGCSSTPGCDGWLTVRVTTRGELDEIMKKAGPCETGAYIEIVTDRYAASALSRKLHESVAALYA
jgi:indolepyruvate decarboxylase